MKSMVVFFETRCILQQDYFVDVYVLGPYIYVYFTTKVVQSQLQLKNIKVMLTMLYNLLILGLLNC